MPGGGDGDGDIDGTRRDNEGRKGRRRAILGAFTRSAMVRKKASVCRQPVQSRRKEC